MWPVELENGKSKVEGRWSPGEGSTDEALTKQHKLDLNGPLCRTRSSVGHVYEELVRGREIEYTEGEETVMA